MYNILNRNQLHGQQNIFARGSLQGLQGGLPAPMSMSPEIANQAQRPTVQESSPIDSAVTKQLNQVRGKTITSEMGGMSRFYHEPAHHNSSGQHNMIAQPLPQYYSTRPNPNMMEHHQSFFP